MRSTARSRIWWHHSLAAESPWHRCDPRVRLLVSLFFSGLALATDGRAFFVAALALAALFVSSRTGPRTALRGLRPFRVLLLLTAGLQVLFTPGRPAAEAAGLPLPGTVEGWAAAGVVLARLCAVILVSSHLVATTSPLELARCVGWAISPARRLGVPVGETMLVLNLGFQFFPVLLEESQLVRAALESRGISLAHPSWRLRLRALLVWILALLFGMVERSGRLAAALQTKGFCSGAALRHRFAPWSRESTLVLFVGMAVAGAWLAALLRR